MPRSELSEWTLKITVGEATELGDKVYQNTACLMVSRTGVVAAFYPDAKVYRTSTDGGLTWSEEMNGPPELGGGIVESDTRGYFRFDGVPLGELVLTVEADGYAPQWRHVKVHPEPESHAVEFHLNPGRALRGRVVDNQGQPVPGASVVLNRWHVYSDAEGYFDWPIEDPVHKQIELKVHKRYHREYKMLEKTILLEEIEQQPVVLARDDRS